MRIGFIVLHIFLKLASPEREANRPLQRRNDTSRKPQLLLPLEDINNVLGILILITFPFSTFWDPVRFVYYVQHDSYCLMICGNRYWQDWNSDKDICKCFSVYPLSLRNLIVNQSWCDILWSWKATYFGLWFSTSWRRITNAYRCREGKY